MGTLGDVQRPLVDQGHFGRIHPLKVDVGEIGLAHPYFGIRGQVFLEPKSVIRLWVDCPLMSCSMLLA